MVYVCLSIYLLVVIILAAIQFVAFLVEKIR